MDQLPICKSGGIAQYHTTVDIPIQGLVPYVVAFDKWIEWSPQYTKMEGEGKKYDQVIPNEQKPVEYQKIRAYRTISSKKTDGDNEEGVVSEKGSAKEGKYELHYETFKYGNPNIDKIVSSIILESVDDKKTKITWQSKTTLKVSVLEKAETLGQAFLKIAYDWIGSHIEDNHNDPFAAYDHPLDKLVRIQENLMGVNCLALALHVVVMNFKDKGFKLINQKMLSIAGQALVANNPEMGDSYGYAEYDIKNCPDMPKMCAGIPVSEVLPPKKFARLLERLLEMVYLQVGSLLEAHNHGQSIKKINYVRSVETLSKVYGSKQDQNLTAHLAKKVGLDEEFCQQLLQGVNPLMIEWLKNDGDVENRIPVGMRNLTITDLDGRQKSVQELFAQRRLFLVDYKLLQRLPNPANEGMYFYAPQVLLYREDLDNHTNRLNIFAIQLQREEEMAGQSPLVYQRKTTPDNLWTLVKMFVTSADNNVHEFGYHLGLSHLANEPVCVATHNQLPRTHVLRTLLQPHLDETIGINFLARNTLVDAVTPITDKNFVIGTNNGCVIACRLWQEYHFYQNSFPRQLAARGFTRERQDGLTSYYYRDDGFRLWDCFGNYVQNVVNASYKDDAAVLTDKAVQNWAQEMADPTRANVKGFPNKIATKQDLMDILQIIIWNGSAFHSVINYSQWPYIGFINNRPNGLYGDVPTDKSEITEEQLDSKLAGPLPTLFQILFPWLLSAPISEDNLPALRAMSGEINEAFQDDLKALTSFINDRNKKLEANGKTPYVFCLPENIACSVSI